MKQEVTMKYVYQEYHQDKQINPKVQGKDICIIEKCILQSHVTVYIIVQKLQV